MAQFLLVTGNEMNAKINSQTNQNRDKGDRENIQVPHGQGGEAHCVGQAKQQAERSFQWPSGFVVAVNENKSDQHERNDTGN